MIAPGIANQLAVLGLSVVPFYSNNTITYNGPYGPLLVQLGNLSPQERQGVKVLNINIIGDVVQESGVCCFVMTIVSAGFCFFPAFFICCDFYQKAIAEIRVVDPNCYESIARTFTSFPNLENIHLVVRDGLFNASKASVLQQQVLRVPKLINFLFRNDSAAANLENNEYDNFPQCFQQLRACTRMMHTLTWGKHTANFTNIQTGAQQSYPGSFEMTNLGMATGYANQPKMMY